MRRARLLLLPALLALAAAGCRGGGAGAPPGGVSGAAAPPPAVRFDAAPGIFPRAWQRPAIAVGATALPTAEQARARAWLAPALAKYPAGFLAAHVEAIHLLADLRFRGVQAGGSNSRRRVYVVLPRGRAARAYFERVVHAEISSILLRRYRARFDRDAWLAGTVPGFRYGASGAAAVRHGLAHAWPTPWALQQGFLYEYGMSSLENDVNSYAAFAFTHPDRLAALAARWPAGVGVKRAGILAFYRALDPRFASLGPLQTGSAALGPP